jgi:PKD repeat protein
MIKKITQSILPLFNTCSLSLLLCFLVMMSAQKVSAQACEISGDTIVCSGEVATYSVSYPGTFNYQWNAFGGVVTGAGTAVSVSWGSTSSGLVTIVIRDQFNNVVCTSSLNVSIRKKPTPAIVPSYSVGCGIEREKGAQGERKDEDPCINACDSTWITYSTANNPGSSYVWTVTGAAMYTPSTSNSITIFWTGIGAGTVKVTETDSFGCVGENEICVNIVGKPKALFSSPTNPIVSGVINICLGQSVNLNNLSSPGLGTPLYKYEWIWGDGDITNQDHPSPFASHAYTTPGTYTLHLVVLNECRCRDTFSVQVVVDSQPGPDIFCISTVCPDNAVTYYTNAVCPTYNWSVTNGTIISGGGTTDQSITILWGSTSPGIISLNTPSCAGMCASPTSVYVPIIPPVATISGPAILCIGDQVKYKISCNIPIDSIEWNLPSGLTLLSGYDVNVHEITVLVTDSFVSGTISVNYYHHVPGSTTGLSCGGTATLNVVARPKLVLSSVSEICEFDNYSLWHYQNNFAPISGNIQWSITGITGAPTYFLTTLPGNTSISVASWTYGSGLFHINAFGTSNQFCNNPQKVLLKVNPAPPPPDSIKGPEPVCPNRPYTYLAYPTASNFAIEWDVVNGTPTTMGGTTISVLWDSTGPYILNAFQIDPITGCKSQALSDTFPSILPLAPSTIIGFDTVCANTPAISYFVSDPGDLFTWSITPSIAGSVVSGQGTNNINIDWNNYTGNATLTVIRSVCGQTISSSKIIHVRNPPLPNIIVPPSACQGASVSMSTSTSAISYNWNFGDGGTGSGMNPSHIYNSPGTYFVVLSVNYGPGCVPNATTSASIIINPKPLVSISTPDPNLFCGPTSTVNMYVADPAAGTTYAWYQSPSTFLTNSNSYSTSVIGSYYVTATNIYGCTSNSNVIPIDTICDTCSHAPVTMDFTRIRQGCNTDSFSGSHSSNGFNPTWTFDDPFSGSNFATGLNPTHTFNEPGFYRVKMCVNVLATNGIDTCKTCIIKVDTIKYKPDFFYNLSCSSTGFTLNLINNTKKIAVLPTPPYSWSISPGGFTSSATNPTTMLAPGTYTVTLVVDGVCTIVKTVVIPPMPQALFSAVDSVCVGTPVAYTNSSVGASNFIWYFGDGASSLVSNANRTFTTAGIYTTKLVVSNNYGCSDSTTKNVLVMPNTLGGFITPSDSTICEGDSILYTVTAIGGYPAYQYLWSNIQASPSIYAKYTGSYYVDITDTKGCFFRTTPVQVLVNPVPKPEIQGTKHMCLGDMEKFGVNYPSSGGYIINWNLLPNNWPSSGSVYFAGGPSIGIGIKTLIVQVTGPTGCVGSDTFTFEVHNNPVAIITPSTFPLCEGITNVLVGSSPSPSIVQTFWNTGWIGDTLTTSIPDQYIYTVVDSFGCKGKAQLTINPLPSFCGYQSGCYEICDTVSELVWYAPVGHASYQWLFNGNPILGATSDTLHVPLYQSGSYQVEVTTFFGCKATSDVTDISFVECGGCVWEIKDTVECGKIDPSGNQTYDVTLQIFNNLGSGAGLNIYPASGSISGLTPTTLAAGWNTVTFNYIPASSDTTHCFKVLTWLKDIRCDTLICIKLPPCDLSPCEKQISFKEFECAGFDSDGNPLYYVCANVFWGGSSGTMLNINTSSGTITPNTFTLINGSQVVCFTFTDLPPYGGPSTFYFSFYDPSTNKSCRDSIKTDHKPCPDICKLEIYNSCAHCEKYDAGVAVYRLDMIIDNPFGSNATVTVLPIGAGTFGAITPNPIGPGMQPVQIMFTDNLPKDTFICFTIMLTSVDGKKCTREICMYLPPCDDVSISKISAAKASMKLAPNPAASQVKVFYNVSSNSQTQIEFTDMTGKKLHAVSTQSNNGMTEIDIQQFAAGTYLVRLLTEGRTVQVQRLVVTR